MMNLEKTIRSIWDFYSDLNEKIPKERVTIGPPGKGVLPYLAIEIDKSVPELLVNTGHLREKINLRLVLRHNDYADARWLMDYLHDIFKNRMIFDTDNMLRAQTGLSGTTIKRLEDRTWLFTIGVVADACLFSDTIPV